MASRDHGVAPACAGDDCSTLTGAEQCSQMLKSDAEQRSQRLQSIASPLRARKPAKRETSTEAKTCIIDAGALNENQESALTGDNISTQTTTPESSAVESCSLPSLPGDGRDHGEASSSLPASITESSKDCIRNYDYYWGNHNSALSTKVELDQLAIDIACRVQSKLQACKFSSFKCVRMHSVYDHLRTAFSEADSNSDGKLSEEEVLDVCQHLDLPSETASQFFTLLDGHQTGFVNWEAFLAKYVLLFKLKSPGSR